MLIQSNMPAPAFPCACSFVLQVWWGKTFSSSVDDLKYSPCGRYLAAGSHDQVRGYVQIARNRVRRQGIMETLVPAREGEVGLQAEAQNDRYGAGVAPCAWPIPVALSCTQLRKARLGRAAFAPARLFQADCFRGAR